MASSAKQPLLLDGALGTELERHGVETTGTSWTAYANRDHPDLIRQIHAAYIKAGADIITANTFRTNTRAVGADAEVLTKRAVELARESAASSGRSVLVAGAIAPVDDCFSPELVQDSSARLEFEHATMATWLHEAGVDIILIETMNTAREAVAAVRAAKNVSSLSVYVSLVPRTHDTILDGTPICAAVDAIAAEGADLVALNCAPLSVMRGAMTEFITAATRAGVAFGCYPNAAEIDRTGNWDLHASSDEDIAALLKEWFAAGATLVGSCCGTTPTTTGLLRSQL